MNSVAVPMMTLPSPLLPQSMGQIISQMEQIPESTTRPFDEARQIRARPQELDLTPEALGFDPIAEQIPVALECAYETYLFRDTDGQLRRVESISAMIEAGFPAVYEDASAGGLDPFVL